MSPGRNDPCPCGSGAKYKHCCLVAQQAAQDARALPWRRVRRALEGFGRRMEEFVLEAYGDPGLFEAWAEFLPGQDVPFSADDPHAPLFVSWTFYHWAPGRGSAVADQRLHGVTPARAMLEREGARLDPLLREYVESAGAFTPSFYEVTGLLPGVSLGLRDVFTGEAFDVNERLATEGLHAGDLLYAALAQSGGITLLEATGPLVFPPMTKVELIDLRKRMRRGRRALSRADLREWDLELRTAYLAITDRLLNPPLPRLHTTDGEAFVHQTLVFDIDSAPDAFEALKHLDCDAGAGTPPGEATRDAQGRITSARIMWSRPDAGEHKGRTTRTILGEIHIEGRRMTADVNSNERATALRAIVGEALGTRARYRMSEVQSAEKLLAAASGRPAADPAAADPAETPEFKAFLAEYTARFYDDWPTQQIPMLGGRTPLQAVRTKDGREMVEALVRDIERRPGLPGPAPDAAVIAKLRRRLGLAGEC